MPPELLAAIYRLLPFLQRSVTPAAASNATAPNNFMGSAPGQGGAPDAPAIQAAIQANPALAGITPGMVTGVSPMAPGPRAPGMGMDALTGMAGALKAAGLGAGDTGGEMRPERYVHGAPQAAQPNVPGPQAAPAFQTMNSPIQSVGAFLLSPQGQRIMQALQALGRPGAA
jgi:hypothetical protein